MDSAGLFLDLEHFRKHLGEIVLLYSVYSRVFASVEQISRMHDRLNTVDFENSDTNIFAQDTTLIIYTLYHASATTFIYFRYLKHKKIIPISSFCNVWSRR